MKKTSMRGQTCVGDIRLSSLDVGHDLRLHCIPIEIPDDCVSVGYDDRDGHTWLIEGTAEEIREELRKNGYEILDTGGR